MDKVSELCGHHPSSPHGQTGERDWIEIREAFSSRFLAVSDNGDTGWCLRRCDSVVSVFVCVVSVSSRAELSSIEEGNA